MPPHERKVLATIERTLRDEDPELAAAFGRTPSPSVSTHEFPLSTRGVLLLLGALTGLIAVCTVLAGRLGPAGLAALTAVAVVPWLVATAWSAGRRSPSPGGTDGGPDRREADDSRRSGDVRPVTAERRLVLAVVPFLVALAVVVPAWQPAIALVLILLAANLLPWLVVSLVERFERRAAAVERVTTSGDDITPATRRRDMVKHIIWATDGSPTIESEHSVVEDLARNSGAKVIVAHAGEMVSREEAGIFVDDTEVLRATLDRTVENLRGAGLDAELALVAASPRTAAESVADLADATGAEVVVTGNRGYGPAAALFLGSFTFRLLQIAPCPVLVVPTGGRRRAA